MKVLVLVYMAAFVLAATGCGKSSPLTEEQVCISSWATMLGPNRWVVVGNGDGTFVPNGCISPDAIVCTSAANTASIVKNGTITCGSIDSIIVEDGIPSWNNSGS